MPAAQVLVRLAQQKDRLFGQAKLASKITQAVLSWLDAA